MLIELTRWTREFRYLWGMGAGLCFLAYLQFSRSISVLPTFIYDFILEACQRGKRVTASNQTPQGVPKSWFRHFYIVGFSMSCVLLFELYEENRASAAPLQAIVATILPFAFFWLHTLRRLLECIFVSRFGRTAKIHVVGYGCGVVYYLTVPPTLATTTPAMDVGSVRRTLSQALGTLIFLAGSLIQSQSHSDLAALRRTKDDAYSLPRGRWFSLCSNPHYFGEILIYVSLCILKEGDRNTLVVLFWVIANLLLAGSISDSWYCKKFPDYKPKYAIIPFLI